MPARDTVGWLDVAARAGGQALRAATVTVALRPAAKPLHPRGGLVRATLSRSGSEAVSGVPWLDDPGSDEVLVRRSRAVGLPAPLPDVFGLAVRVPTAQGYGDLLLATTGLGRVTRFVLTVSRSPHGRPMTTLLPYRTSDGPLLIGAVASGPRVLRLAWARPRGPWHRFAELDLGDDPATAPDPAVSFDPVRNPVPGLGTYAWVRELREPAYATARRTRQPGR